MAEEAKAPVKTGTQPAVASGAHVAPLDFLRREIDRIFDSFDFTSWRAPFGRSPFGLDVAWPREGGWPVTPAVDIAEKEKGYEISVELPGLSEKDVELGVANNMLTIKGEKKEEKEERQKDYFVSERRYGSFVRSFRIPDGVDSAKIDATFSKGVLTVVLPKSAEAQRNEQKIAIKAA